MERATLAGVRPMPMPVPMPVPVLVFVRMPWRRPRPVPMTRPMTRPVQCGSTTEELLNTAHGLPFPARVFYCLRMNASSRVARLPLAPIDDDVVTLAVEVLRILADPTRLRIAALLLDRELSVSELAEQVARPVPGVSQHLAKMRLAHLVATRREGTTVHYRIVDEHIRQLVLDTTRHVEHLISDRPAHHEPAGSTHHGRSR
jgi:DNA-binding transcriptional ArsR family regulator